MPGAHLLWIEAPEIRATARPGQFVMVRCGEGYDPLLRRPLSIHRISHKGLALLFAVVGRGTDWLAGRREGETIDLLGPLGNGFSIHPQSKNLLLVAGGIGIAPLIFLADEATSERHNVTILLGAQRQAQLYPLDSIPSKVELHIVTEDGSTGRKGMVTDLLPDFAPHADQIFACGPPSMYIAMMNLEALNDKPTQVSLETRMGCGVGACLGCAIETKEGMRRVCRDGPVFELGELTPANLTR